MYNNLSLKSPKHVNVLSFVRDTQLIHRERDVRTISFHASLMHKFILLLRLYFIYSIQFYKVYDKLHSYLPFAAAHQNKHFTAY